MSTILDRVVFRVAIVYGLGVLAAMTVSEAVPQLEAIAREFHPQSPSTVGLVMTLPSLVVALFAILAGYFVDRFGDKAVLFVGGVTTIAGDGIVAAAASLPVLLTGRVVSGFGYVLMSVSAVTLLVRITHGKRRTMALALWSTFVPVSFLVPFVTAGFVASAGSWRVAFGAHAALIAIMLFVAAVSLPSRDATSFGASRTAGLAAVLRSPWPYLLGVASGADAFLFAGITSTLAPYLHARYGADLMSINGWNTAGMVVNAAGCLLLGKLLNWDVPPLRIGIVALVITALPALVLYALPLGIGLSIACSWIFMFGSGVLTGMWAFVPSVAPSPASIGATGGVVTQLALFGVLLSGPICFSAQASPSLIPMLIVVAIGLVFCFACIPILIRGVAPRPALQPAAVAGKPA